MEAKTNKQTEVEHMEQAREDEWAVVSIFGFILALIACFFVTRD